MNGLEEQADDAKPRDLGTFIPTTVNDAWDPAPWQTFFSTTLGLELRAQLTQVPPKPTDTPTRVADALADALARPRPSYGRA